MSILQQPIASRSARETIDDGRVLRLAGGDGQLEVLTGRVWLTSAGDPADHVLTGGESMHVDGRGALVESWGGAAVVAWQTSDRGRGAIAGACAAVGRCWQFMNPLARAGIGSTAALAALLVGALVFGPLSEARSRSLAQPAGHAAQVGAAAARQPARHNAPGAVPSLAAAAWPHADAPRLADRARFAAQEARRYAPGAA